MEATQMSTQKGQVKLLSICTTGLFGSSGGKEPDRNSGDPIQSLGQENPLEKGTATHSSTPAWRIPRTEEPGGPQSLGLRNVGLSNFHYATEMLHTHF